MVVYKTLHLTAGVYRDNYQLVAMRMSGLGAKGRHLRRPIKQLCRWRRRDNVMHAPPQALGYNARRSAARPHGSCHLMPRCDA